MSSTPHTYIEYFAITIAWIVVIASLLQVTFYLIQIVIASYSVRKYPKGNRKLLIDQYHWNITPPISIIVPAFNEEKTIQQSIHSILNVNYPVFDVIIVNDGSTDHTLAKLKKAFDLYLIDKIDDLEDSLQHAPIRGVYASKKDSRITVIDKQNGGKADSQNAGISFSRSPLVCSIDADTILDIYALLKATEPFIYDPKTIAVGGTIQIANGSTIKDGMLVEAKMPRSLLAILQVLEYLRSFLMGRLAWSHFNTVMIISGAFGIFRRKEIMAVGGYTRGSMGEDYDLIVKLHHHMRTHHRDYRISFVPDAVCWTEAPETLSVLRRQRIRWQMGALEVINRYRSMIFSPSYGRVGMVGASYAAFVDIVAPLCELVGYFLLPTFWFFGYLSLNYLLALLGITFAFGVFITTLSISLGEVVIKQFTGTSNLILLFIVAIIENLGYRQLCSWWRLRGIWRFFRGKHEWGNMERRGFKDDKID